MTERMIPVRWYTCNCELISKHCDEYHTAFARVPVSVLEPYRPGVNNALAGAAENSGPFPNPHRKDTENIGLVGGAPQ